MRMRHGDVLFEKKNFLTNSGRKKSALSQRDPPAKIVLAKFLHQNDRKKLYVVSLHCWRCALTAATPLEEKLRVVTGKEPPPTTHVSSDDMCSDSSESRNTDAQECMWL